MKEIRNSANMSLSGENSSTTTNKSLSNLSRVPSPADLDLVSQMIFFINGIFDPVTMPNKRFTY